MKRIRIILSVAILLAALSGCGNQKVQSNDVQADKNTNVNESTTESKKEDTTSTNSDEKNKDSNAKKDNTSTNSNKTENSTNSSSSTISSNTANKNSKEQKSFYGTWQIKKVAGYAKVGTGENKELIGLKITLSKDLATLGNESYDNPKYEVTNKTNNDLGKNTNISDMGVKANSIDELDVLNKEDNVMTLYIKDDNTLIYSSEGTYYETIRVS